MSLHTLVLRPAVQVVGALALSDTSLKEGDLKYKSDMYNYLYIVPTLLPLETDPICFQNLYILLYCCIIKTRINKITTIRGCEQNACFLLFRVIRET